MDEKNMSASAPETSEPESDRMRRDIHEWIECVVMALAVCVLIFVFLFRVTEVVGSSMVPTLQDGDRLIISNIFYKPRQGDIVVLCKQSFKDEAIVKRVIATEGQTVDIDFSDGTVTVDGMVLEEDYIAEPATEAQDFDSPVTVPEGCIFVMGDNRNASTDSRSDRLGCIEENMILGKVIVRILPFSKIGSVY